jgi:hypothetical protein
MYFLLILLVLAFYAGTRFQMEPIQVYAEPMSSELPVLISAAADEPPVPDRAERTMKALAQAYPDRVGPAEFRDGDWAVPLGGQWFYYAGGRLLPGERRNQAAEYSGIAFYNYAAELPPWTPPDAEYSARMREMTERRRNTSNNNRQTTRRSQYFWEALWRIRNRDDSWERQKTVYFLGQQVMVHSAILNELCLVEEIILREARTSSAVRRWIDSLGTISGWTWRNVADSESRSFHAYGVAIDILPRNLGNLATYWLWTYQHTPEWWAIPYTRRYHPPDEVIRAFESLGFIWGGKWLYYDTMHFEYRPEVFILNNIPMIDLRNDLN